MFLHFNGHSPFQHFLARVISAAPSSLHFLISLFPSIAFLRKSDCLAPGLGPAVSDMHGASAVVHSVGCSLVFLLL